jgi:hypothetical protein
MISQTEIFYSLSSGNFGAFLGIDNKPPLHELTKARKSLFCKPQSYCSSTGNE